MDTQQMVTQPPNTQVRHERIDVRTVRLSARVSQLAADAYRCEQEMMSAREIEPFSSLAPASQAVYVRRVQVMLAGGVGYLHGKAHDAAIRKIVTEHDVFDEYTEDAAKHIESMLGDVVQYYEAALLAEWKERAR